MECAGSAHRLDHLLQGSVTLVGVAGNRRKVAVVDDVEDLEGIDAGVQSGIAGAREVVGLADRAGTERAETGRRVGA